MKHLMNWGAILGFVLILYSLGLYLMGLNESKAGQWLSYAIIAGVLYVATNAKRDAQDGTLSYGEGLGTGTGVAFFGSIIVAFYTYVFFHFIDPDMLEQLILRAEDQLYEQGMASDQIDMAMTYTRKFMQPGPMAAMVVLSYTFVGFIVALITSAILKKEETPFGTDASV